MICFSWSVFWIRTLARGSPRNEIKVRWPCTTVVVLGVEVRFSSTTLLYPPLQVMTCMVRQTCSFFLSVFLTSTLLFKIWSNIQVCWFIIHKKALQFFFFSGLHYSFWFFSSKLDPFSRRLKHSGGSRVKKICQWGTLLFVQNVC